MFITFYEISTDANILEIMVWFAIHVIFQLLAALAFVLLVIFAAAEQVFAFYHGRQSYGYKNNAREFGIGAILLTFGVMGIAISAKYWMLLPLQNQWFGWSTSFPMILVCIFIAGLSASRMICAWKVQRQFG